MATKEYHKVSLYRETATLTDESITPGAPSGTLKLGASGNFGVHYLQVELGDGWQGLTVHAIFWLDGAGVLGNSMLSNGEISIPAAVTASATSVGFVTFSGTSSGVNKLTATLPFIVTAGPPSEGEPAPEPDPSLWQQLFEKMEEVVSGYILPIMSEETLGGGRAIKKTTETVPVAVDPLDGRLYVPEQSGGGGDYKLPQATESTLGGIKAKQRTSETLEVAIDEATGKLYVPQQGGGGSYVLPVATEGVLGGVKAPAKTSETVKVVVDADGFLYIKDYAEKSAIPTKVSQLQNDSNFLTKESDPTVSEWAKQPQKPTYTAEEVGAQAKGDYALKSEIPQKLPNPQVLTFTGAVSKTYDGSSAVTVNIPTGGGGGGEPGVAAGFGTPTATASALEPGAQPTVEIEASGPDTAKIFAFTFGIPKGKDGTSGKDGADGKTPVKGEDYWTTEEQQQIVQEAATAAAKKVPTATAEQAGTIKAEPVESAEGLQPLKIGPDGKGYTAPGSGGSGGAWVKVGSVTSESDGETLTVSGIGGAKKVRLIMKVATTEDNRGIKIYFGEDPYTDTLNIGTSTSVDFGYSIMEFEINSFNGQNLVYVPPFEIPKSWKSNNINAQSTLSASIGALIFEADAFDSASVTSANGSLKIGSTLEVWKWQ